MRKRHQITEGPGQYGQQFAKHEKCNATIAELRKALEKAISESGFYLSGPRDWRAAEAGEPRWVCYARGVLADTEELIVH